MSLLQNRNCLCVRGGGDVVAALVEIVSDRTQYLFVDRRIWFKIFYRVLKVKVSKSNAQAKKSHDFFVLAKLLW